MEDKKKLFMVYRLEKEFTIIYMGMRVAESYEELREEFKNPEIQFLEIDEVDGYHINLQKMI